MSLTLKITVVNVTVNYGLTLEEMIRGGCYGEVDPGITGSNFPLSGHGRLSRQVKLASFGICLPTPVVITELEQFRLIPAPLEFVLGIGSQHPGIQEKTPVVCLGSRWKEAEDDKSVPAIGIHEGKRVLCLCYYDLGEWEDNCVFPVFSLN